MKLGRMLMTTAAVAVLLGALATAASARNLSISSQQLRAQFREIRFQGLFGTSNCQLTVEGSFHSRTIAKLAGTLVGYITRSALGPCVTGSVTVLSATLPWHVQYSGFAGTLPNITSIRAHIVGVSFNVRTPEGFTCLSRSTVEQPVSITFNREIATRVVSDAVVGGTLESSCGVQGTFASDRGPVTVLNSTTRITITLI